MSNPDHPQRSQEHAMEARAVEWDGTANWPRDVAPWWVCRQCRRVYHSPTTGKPPARCRCLDEDRNVWKHVVPEHREDLSVDPHLQWLIERPRCHHCRSVMIDPGDESCMDCGASDAICEAGVDEPEPTAEALIEQLRSELSWVRAQRDVAEAKLKEQHERDMCQHCGYVEEAHE